MTTTVLPWSTSSCSTSRSLLDVVEVEAGGGFVEEIERAAGGALGEFLGELDALGFAAGQRGGLLADLDVAEADALQRIHLVAHGRHGAEEFGGFVDGHVQHIGDGLVLELDVQRFTVVALSVAGIAGDIDIGQEVHLDLDDAIALAGFAAATLDVEGEASGFIAAGLGFGQPCEPDHGWG